MEASEDHCLVDSGQSVLLKDPDPRISRSNMCEPTTYEGDGLADFLGDEKFSDFLLVAGEVEVCASRLVLCSRSTFFRQELISNPTLNLFEFDSYPTDVVISFIHFLYGLPLTNVSSDAPLLLRMAYDFGVDRLKLYCVKEMTANLRMSNFLSYMKLGQELNDGSLKRSCYSFALQHDT